jgi:hypothetical protein
MHRYAPRELAERFGVLHCSFRGVRILSSWNAQLDGTLYPDWEKSDEPALRSVSFTPDEPSTPFTLHIRGLKKVRLNAWDDEAIWEFTARHPVLLPFGRQQTVTIVRPHPEHLSAIQRHIIDANCDHDELTGIARWVTTLSAPPDVALLLPEALATWVLQYGAEHGVTMHASDVRPPSADVTALIINNDYVVAESFEMELAEDAKT